ncbi:hypothetical protein [Labrys wisconsinensis]|uniref:Glycosyltransferase RgtA/B/C/D-like domain-containing protein n=1 Tax=Labrys wisconsinensis TaxID=425677 RepID=A0ABU0JCG0_9HYPH|nr:hypothetical protein [Labrys wisconsinensis]MDQ0471181.1 hypothetical protein [Labrys wisconsinensis]
MDHVRHGPVATGSLTAGPQSGRRIAAGRVLRHAPVALALAAAVAMRLANAPCTDVSWLLTLGEKMLGGATPYVDFVEVNPPASILLYLPAILLARIVDVRPETMVVWLVFVGAGASLALTGRILARAGLRRPGDPWLPAVAVFLLLVLPDYAFAQREHVALIAVLPLLAVYAVRAAGRAPGLGPSLLAGLGGGVAVIVKPHFALGLALPMALVLYRTPFGAGAWLRAAFDRANRTVVAVVGVYVVAILAFFPAFVTAALPLAAAVYVPVGSSISIMLLNPSGMIAALALGFAAVNRPQLRDPVTTVLALAATGFWLAMVLQMKGWPYHGYPAMALALLAGARSVADRWAAAVDLDAGRLPVVGRLVAPAVGLAVLCGGAATWLDARLELPALTQAVRELGPPRPRIAFIGGDLSVGHPLVRDVDGDWVGHACSNWISGGAAILLAKLAADDPRRTALQAYARMDRARQAADIAEGRPDIVLVEDEAWMGWALRDPAVGTALAPFRTVRRVDGVSIMTRSATGTD